MMSDEHLELIAAGFTAILGFHVVHGPAGQGLPKLSIRNLFHCTYIPRSLESFAPEDVFDVHVKTITGANTWKVVLQNRVNPAPGHLCIVEAKDTGAGAEYWLSPKQDIDNKVYDIRPYGLLFKTF